mgnify:CR=1 FL=1
MSHFNILLVEDNEGDILLTREAFEEAEIPVIINVVKNGEHAIQFLNKREKFIDVSTPDLILLDINIPKMDGFEVLKYIKEHEHYRKIPVIMLTTSSSREDVMKSYKYHANSFISKPMDMDEFWEVIESIESFWLKTNRLPPN